MVWLHRWFHPCVGAGKECLGACWRFDETTPIAYTHAEIRSRTHGLAQRGAFDRLTVNNDLIRTIGFNNRGPAYVELDHWARVHLFTTTTPFERSRIPGRLLFKPTGWTRFAGFFNVTDAFCVNEKKVDNDVRRYFRDYYFYSYEDTSVADDHDGTGFVYKDFIPFDRVHGTDLYNRLMALKYPLGVQGSKVIRPEHAKLVAKACRLAGS